MTGRNKDRFDVFPRTVNPADLLVIYNQRRRGALPGTDLIVLTDESFAGASDRREVEDKAQMAGQPKVPGMGDSMTGENNKVWRCPQPRESFQYNRPFAKGVQAGNIWE